MINLNMIVRVLRKTARVVRNAAVAQEAIQTGSPLPFIRRAYNRMIARQLFSYTSGFWWRKSK